MCGESRLSRGQTTHLQLTPLTEFAAYPYLSLGLHVVGGSHGTKEERQMVEETEGSEKEKCGEEDTWRKKNRQKEGERACDYTRCVLQICEQWLAVLRSSSFMSVKWMMDVAGAFNRFILLNMTIYTCL